LLVLHAIDACPRIRKGRDLSAVEISRAFERAAGDVKAAARQLEVSAHALKQQMTALGIRLGSRQ
jgi:transcriptional regulator with GAF, ATPase, and Fis domain